VLGAVCVWSDTWGSSRTPLFTSLFSAHVCGVKTADNLDSAEAWMSHVPRGDIGEILHELSLTLDCHLVTRSPVKGYPVVSKWWTWFVATCGLCRPTVHLRDTCCAETILFTQPEANIICGK